MAMAETVSNRVNSYVTENEITFCHFKDTTSYLKQKLFLLWILVFIKLLQPQKKSTPLFSSTQNMISWTCKSTQSLRDRQTYKRVPFDVIFPLNTQLSQLFFAVRPRPSCGSTSHDSTASFVHMNFPIELEVGVIPDLFKRQLTLINWKLQGQTDLEANLRFSS